MDHKSSYLQALELTEARQNTTEAGGETARALAYWRPALARQCAWPYIALHVHDIGQQRHLNAMPTQADLHTRVSRERSHLAN